jgi:ribosomal protein S6--L-glutamate ligase
MRILILTRQPRLHSIRRLRQACDARGVKMETMDVTRVAIAMHPRRPRLYYNGEEVDPKRYDVIIPRIGTSITEVGCSVVRQFEAMGVPIINRSSGILRGRDKLRSMQLLSRLDIDIPKSMIIRRSAELDNALDLVGGVPCVLKLLQGTQGVGVMLVESKEAIESVLQAFWSLGHTLMLQEFIKESKGKDVRALVIGDKVVAAMRREATLGEFRSNIHRGGLGRSIKLSAEEERVVVQATKAMGLGIAGVDYLESHQGPKVLEVNSSPGFEGLEQATRADIAGAIIDFAIQFVNGEVEI